MIVLCSFFRFCQKRFRMWPPENWGTGPRDKRTKNNWNFEKYDHLRLFQTQHGHFGIDYRWPFAGPFRNIQRTLSWDISNFIKLKDIIIPGHAMVLWPNLVNLESGIRNVTSKVIDSDSHGGPESVGMTVDGLIIYIHKVWFDLWYGFIFSK